MWCRRGAALAGYELGRLYGDHSYDFVESNGADGFGLDAFAAGLLGCHRPLYVCDANAVAYRFVQSFVITLVGMALCRRFFYFLAVITVIAVLGPAGRAGRLWRAGTICGWGCELAKLRILALAALLRSGVRNLGFRRRFSKRR